MKARDVICPLLLLYLHSVVPAFAFLVAPSSHGVVAGRDVHRLHPSLGPLGSHRPSSSSLEAQHRGNDLGTSMRRSSLSVRPPPKRFPLALWSSLRVAFARFSSRAARLSLTCLLVLSAFLSSARPARAAASPSLSSYDPSAPALHIPGAEKYVKKFMWSADKYNLFESAYLGADQQSTEALGSQGKGGLSGAMVGKLLVEAGPSLAVGGLIVGGGVGAVKLDRYMKGVKEKWREEEIELYGEELTVDATPVEMPDVELPDEEEDDDTDGNASESGEN
ncbi:hypothetical protein TrLO_g7865 [Triparma laevis f. longispina]|uniref:Uncharacterized protein n=1 Tax=Triparma laevis f. longispina TaxID=1714387 RepID=A0A9W7A067_9STRA|nr:hypothetical protein TrLO_g7865 [Triparma laevis f. longispina]